MADLLVEQHGRTTVLTLNRPDRLNALGATILEELAEAVRDFAENKDQYVAVITGAGEKAFCAGADLKEMAEGVATGNRMPIARNTDMYGVASCEKVTIAAINGLAVGGGLEIAISCDIRIACEQAWFGMFEVQRGFLGGVGVNVLPRLMPIGAVMDLMLTGDPMSVHDAFRLGLVQAIVPQEDVLATALAKAEKISRHSQAAVWGTKKVLQFWRNALLAEQHRFYQAVTHRVLLSGDFLDGPRAFAEKREPVFSEGWPSPFDNGT